MAQITIDTDKDSAQAMRRIIQVLEHYVAEKTGDVPITNVALEIPVQNTNPFAMFGDQTTNSQSENSGQNYSSTSTPAHGQDMFSMFSNDTPSSSPANYGNTSSSRVISAGLSAQDLLQGSSEDEFEDDETLKKKDQDFFQLMQY